MKAFQEKQESFMQSDQLERRDDNEFVFRQRVVDGPMDSVSVVNKPGSDSISSRGQTGCQWLGKEWLLHLTCWCQLQPSWHIRIL